MSKAVGTKTGDAQTGSLLFKNDALHLAFCVVGVVGSLLLYGVLQERIMTMPYGEGENAEVFKYSLFLVFCNRAVAATIAAITLVIKGKTDELKPVAPILSYASVSLSNVVATTCQYEALKHVTFAVQTLGKCAKMFPVMIWGYFILKKRYTMRDVALALCITGGCFIFFMTGNTTSRVAQDKNSSMFGQKMFKGYQMTSYNQVLYVSLCSLVLSSFGLVTSGQLSATLGFITRHPDALSAMILLSCASSCGSLFISYTIKSFGALVFAIIMTTRQFLSILLSSLFFGSPLTGGQWAGTGVVVAALYYQSATKDSHAKDKDAKEPAPKNVSLAGVGTANSGSGDHARDEEAATAQPLLVSQQR
ncbi:UDP galactose transporter-related protein [Scenedesmus sp. NREL 46B-D3]|nr:UDP galactose transporter-related protein [Scenedesmus sp. NREL 46B-D3]